MARSYNINRVTLNTPFRSGHETYLNAEYTPLGESVSHKIIYKKNKHGQPKFSRLEVMFSHLARKFLLTHLTPLENLVVNDSNQVVGLSVQHLCYLIGSKEGLEQPFFTVNTQESAVHLEEVSPSDVRQIPFYFLDKLPQGFYAKLVKAEKEGLVSIDYASLASILATSYTLEEDDLHRGNFGFYLVKKHGKAHAVFFKVDHDLMFIDSIMAFHVLRPLHLIHGARAFDITAEDLLSLACLKNSCNSYWPTNYSYLANPFDNKHYHSSADIKAFSDLAHHPEFIKAKWNNFNWHAAITQESIAADLQNCVEKESPSCRAQIALIMQAVIARQARLRAVLFSIPDFRDNVPKWSGQDDADYGFEQGDTPLHVAIKLGEYRYEETSSMFAQFINTANALGKTPLDVALERMDSVKDNPEDIRKDICFIIKHLLSKGAQETQKYKKTNLDRKIKAYTCKNPYLQGIEAMDYEAFRDRLRDIGEDHRFCLKFKKNLAQECIQSFIDSCSDKQILLRLRKDIDGHSSEAESDGLKYIRQLRSKLWIVRQVRGLYGLSTTQWEIQGMIGRAIGRINNRAGSSCFSFFSSSSSKKAQEATLNRGLAIES